MLPRRADRSMLLLMLPLRRLSSPLPFRCYLILMMLRRYAFRHVDFAMPYAYAALFRHYA